LYQAGLSSFEVEKATTRFRQTRAKAAKIPTQAELFAMFKKSLIDEPTLRDSLQLLGFGPQWVDLLVQLHS